MHRERHRIIDTCRKYNARNKGKGLVNNSVRNLCIFNGPARYRYILHRNNIIFMSVVA